MELFFFDIETATEYKNFNTFLESDERGANLFKSKYERTSLSGKDETVEESYINNAGIVSTYGRIVCISFGYIDNTGEYRISSYYGDNEKEIVKSFNNLLKKIETKNFNLCGYRINYFDIPWILHKLHKYEIDPANIIYTYDKKPWDMRIVDLADDWKQKFAWTFSFDEMCYELGVKSPKDKIDGSMVNEYYHNGKIELVKEYCEKDVRASIDASKKLYK